MRPSRDNQGMASRYRRYLERYYFELLEKQQRGTIQARAVDTFLNELKALVESERAKQSNRLVANA